MLSKEPSSERAKLGFKEAVLSNFKFLTKFGLRAVDEGVTLVRYESNQVFVNVYHGRASFELNVEIGRLTQPENEKLTIHDIVSWAGAKNAEGFGKHVMFQVSSVQGVKECVPKLANLVQKYAIPFIEGDSIAYDRALEARSRDGAEYVKQVSARQLRRRAEAAWQVKDYVQVAELYARMRNELSEVEAKRLSYAEHQVLENAGSRSPVLKKH